MKRKFKIQVENYEFLCDSCGKRIVQDGKDISLIPDPEKKYDYLFHFHTSCLVNHLKETYIPNP